MKKTARTRLIEERKRQQWSQQELADRIGTTRHNVSRWESGVTSPGPYFRAKLCELFGKQAQELGLFPENQPATADAETREGATPQPVCYAGLPESPELWGVPHPRNPFFTGRETPLRSLHEKLSREHGPEYSQRWAISGLGGIGKTQVVVEYAYRHAQEYRAIFWVAAENIERILTSYLTIAELLGLPEREETDQQRIVAAVQRWLTANNNWLLIWDNLEILELLRTFLSPTRQGTVLITTRHQALGTLAQDLELSPMTPEEGIVLLLRRARVIPSLTPGEQIDQFSIKLPAEYDAARTLVTDMGGLPLALDQAGAYMEETGCSPSNYLHLYEQRRAQLLDRRGNSGDDHPNSVTTTFLLASQRIEQDHPAAAELLRVCALLYAEAIPEEIFMKGALYLSPVLTPLATDSFQFDQSIAALRTFSLVQRQPETRMLSIHRLVQVTLQEQMSEQERMQRQQCVLCMLNALFPEVTYSVWKQCERLLPHVLACMAEIPDHVQDQNLASVLKKAGDYLSQRAQYEQARPVFERVQRIREKSLGPEHPLLADALNGLAILYYYQGQYEQARPVFERVLYIREKTLEPEHPLLAEVLNSIANVYSEQGKYERAEPMYKRALLLWEQGLGAEHPEVTYALGGLAELYFDQGKYEQAELLYERALHIREQAFGPEHPDVAYVLNRLATLYIELRKYEQARLLNERALRIREQILGPEHPLVAYPLGSLAKLYSEQGKYEKAAALYERALSIREKALGQFHSKTVAIRTSYIALLWAMGQQDKATALEIRRPEHENAGGRIPGIAEEKAY